MTEFLHGLPMFVRVIIGSALAGLALGGVIAIILLLQKLYDLVSANSQSPGSKQVANDRAKQIQVHEQYASTTQSRTHPMSSCNNCKSEISPEDCETFERILGQHVGGEAMGATITWRYGNFRRVSFSICKSCIAQRLQNFRTTALALLTAGIALLILLIDIVSAESGFASMLVVGSGFLLCLVGFAYRIKAVALRDVGHLFSRIVHEVVMESNCAISLTDKQFAQWNRNQ